MKPDLKNHFLKWCKDNGVTPVAQLQESYISGKERESDVWLVRDKDSIFKVFKEIFDHEPGPMREIYPREDESLFRIHLGGPRMDFLPNFYGTVEIEDKVYLKKSFVYGQPLSDYCTKDNLLSKEDAFYVLARIACNLDRLLDQRMLFQDLRPENVLISFLTGDRLAFDVGFPDVGLSTFIENREDLSRAAITHPRYCPPETAFKHEASEKSLVFQLGLIAQELLTGIHPFDKFPGQSLSMDWDQNCHRFIDSYDESDLPPGTATEFIGRMIDLKPEKRPGLRECITEFEPKNKLTIKRKGIGIPEEGMNSILFPARMGILHRGHINFMSRILDLGYKLVVSIQRSYTSTERDPVPKWLIMKMVAQSLMELGYPKESFKIFLTPFYEQQRQMQMHFGMLPGVENIVAVASSNKSVHNLFSEYKIITQQHVFGSENSEYIDLSWGEFIRGAVKNDDYETFKKYAAIGVESILSFEELRTICATRPEIPFVPGKALVRLVDSNDAPITKGRVLKYRTPEESLIRTLRELGTECIITDPYSKETKVLWQDQEKKFSYENIQFDGQDELITFKLS
jgi:serine/threonine protein kinase